MKRYIFLASIIASAIFTSSSCADMLEQEPANAITAEQIRELLESGDTTKIDLVIGGIANSLPGEINKDRGGADVRVNSPLRLQYSNSLLGYDIVCGITEGGDVMISGPDAYQAYTSRSSASSTYNLPYWDYGWKCVTAANKMLYYLPEAINTGKLKDYKARALTLRAYAYNFLMENYRGAYSADGEGLMIYDQMGSGTYKPVVSAKATYDFIKGDLNEAVSLFAESGIGEAKDGYTSYTEDIDLAVANFVLARVSLLTGDYKAAIDACDAILAKYPDFIKLANYGGQNSAIDGTHLYKAEENAFLKFNNNPEVIFGFASISGNQNVASAMLNIFGGGNGGWGQNWSRIVNTLYDKININDVRKGAFLGDNSISNYVYNTSSPKTLTIPTYSNLKFATTQVGGKSLPDDPLTTFDICYMRSSEVWLMKAEAQAKNNSESGAKQTLNTLLAARTKTGDPLTCDNYGGGATTILAQIQLQWRIEMWGENGLEYYNNKRWGVAVNRNDGSIHWNRGVISVDLMTLEIPTDETVYNPNL
jgi:hypothetical protein